MTSPVTPFVQGLIYNNLAKSSVLSILVGSVTTFIVTTRCIHKIDANRTANKTAMHVTSIFISIASMLVTSTVIFTCTGALSYASIMPLAFKIIPLLLSIIASVEGILIYKELPSCLDILGITK